jgi:hypothetical protein
MNFISDVLLLWFILMILGWGAAVYLKQNGSCYLAETEQFGENVAVYFGLIFKIWVDLIAGAVGAILTVIALLN